MFELHDGRYLIGEFYPLFFGLWNPYVSDSIDPQFKALLLLPPVYRVVCLFLFEMVFDFCFLVWRILIISL